MQRTWIVLALIVGCEKNEPAVKPPASDVAPMTDVDVVVESRRVVVAGHEIADVVGALDRAALEKALSARDRELVVGIAPDATYQRLLDVMDVAIVRGLRPVLDLAGKGTTDVTLHASTAISDEPILVLTISTDAIILGHDVVATIADLPPGDDIPALRDAITASPRKHVMLEADGRTRGDVLIRALATARSAGLPDLKFVRRRAPAYPPPRKKTDSP
ncbi:MAG TPA: hypothetical protein VML75_02150 [Kofleriaceae bacterium]|nr:hypothetical protein [Kofleriaceae bacterium]